VRKVCPMQSLCAIARIATPIGLVELTATEAVLTGVRLNPSDSGLNSVPTNHGLLQVATQQIEDWFAGARKDFDLPLLALATPRANALRAGIAAINYGETVTYGALAARLGSSPRAIGQACRRNAFPIIIPCHRVTSAADKEFYSGGDGPPTKAWLNAFERGQAYDYGSDQLF
jgi:methylated-DNA-[protein]-cysteine S-methyltransferase